MRPAGKARRPSIPVVCEGGATPPRPGSPTRQPRWGGGGMQRRSNADGVAPRAANRDAILRAAIDVFAGRGYFNAQVADVALAAGIAAGTVYLYFRSKDDLLISIFERSMREALAEGKKVVEGVDDPRERLRRVAGLHLTRLGRDRNLTVVFQVELRQSTKFMERFSSTLLRDYLGLLRDAIA